MKYLIGIDDTDNKDTRGTGFRGRELAALITENHLGKVFGVTRHQLLFHPDVPYTSHNSSACLSIETDKIEQVTQFCKEYLIRIAAIGSDIALCVAPLHSIPEEVMAWGKKCKVDVVKQSEARQIAFDHRIFLEGYTGTQDGVIGALAAVGLHAWGNDGRYIWVGGKELRDYPEIVSVAELQQLSGVDIVSDKNNKLANPSERIFTGGWMRPVRQKSKIKLVVNQISNHKDYEWTVTDKEYIKAISN
ncbi:MAG: hypothetical protein JEZ03_17635 [Bacteroidales bacterium]|nr:hypothetical protein [Bacteroidales bacterium]